MTCDEFKKAMEAPDLQSGLGAIKEVVQSVDPRDETASSLGYELAVVAGYGRTEERRAARQALEVVYPEGLANAARFGGFRRRRDSCNELAASLNPDAARKSIANWAWSVGADEEDEDEDEDEEQEGEGERGVYTEDELQMAAILVRYPDLIPTLITLLGRRRTRYKAYMVLSLVGRERAEVAQLLSPLLRGPAGPVRRAALNILDNAGRLCVGILPELLDLYAADAPRSCGSDRGDTDLQSVLVGVGQVDDRVADALIDLLESELNPGDRDTPTVLAEVAPHRPHARSRLLPLLNSSQAVLRAHAVSSLGSCEEDLPAILSVLAKDLPDPCPGIRRLARAAARNVFAREASFLKQGACDVIENGAILRDFAEALITRTPARELTIKSWRLTGENASDNPCVVHRASTHFRRCHLRPVRC